MLPHRDPSSSSSEQPSEEGVIARLIARSTIGVGIFSMAMFCFALILPSYRPRLRPELTENGILTVNEVLLSRLPQLITDILMSLYALSWPINIILSILTLIFVHRDRRLRRSALTWSPLAIVAFVIFAIVYYFEGSLLTAS